ncbi:MAG: hypothetical protein OXE52_05710 [Chloroflexi bacterium]|nr:hypothetical protein [Chloroflexota bacterium]
MYNIYHFFAFLINVRKLMLNKSKMTKWNYSQRSLSYFSTTGFPTMALRLNPRGNPPGGELIGFMESKTYVVPPFKSHIPAGALSIASLGHKKASAVDRQMRSNGEDWRWLPMRDVYYLIRGRRFGHTLVCLVHGSFFETVTCEQTVRKALDQVLADYGDNEKQRFTPVALDSMSRMLSREISSNRLRQIANTTVDFRLNIRVEVAHEVNILDWAYYPEIKNDSINLVIPYRSKDDFRVAWHYLKTVLAEEWTAGKKHIVQHPFNGKFFVLSYDL